MSEQIQVCKGWWRQRCGDIVRVWSNGPKDAEYPWASASYTYTHDGLVLVHSHPRDLVEFLGEEIEIRRVVQ